MEKTQYPTFPVLIVDDEEQALLSARMRLRSAGINNIICCRDSREVMDIFSNRTIGITLLDLTMPHISGRQIQSMIMEKYPDVPIIVVTGSNDVETAVQCMKAGAFDYMLKPVEENRMLSSIKRAIEMRDLKIDYTTLKDQILSGRLKHPEAFSEIITNNPKLHAVFEYIETVAHTSKSVLITGETGVGKELIARALYTVSGLKGDFVAINVAGLDDNMFSDTLFGHVKGAFTDARNSRSGLIESASGGTLFLDEIGDLSLASQVKLLRLLQEREYFPLGSDKARRSDARIIVATNQDLEELLKKGIFRSDLYYRLLTHRILVPALRERLDDLPLLIEHFLDTASGYLKKKKPTPPPELLTLLSTYDFPGNIRELESLIFEAVSKHKSGKLSTGVFKSYLYKENNIKDSDVISEEEEKEIKKIIFHNKLPTLKEVSDLLVFEAMKRSNSNQTIAARALGISQPALSKRLKHTE